MRVLLRRGLPAALMVLGVVAGQPAPAAAQSSDPSFRLNNRTGMVVREVYVSSSNDNSWGSDHLGSNVLASGQTLVIRLPQGQCVNDIRVVMANGQTHERRQVNTCQITDYNLQ